MKRSAITGPCWRQNNKKFDDGNTKKGREDQHESLFRGAGIGGGIKREN